MNLQESVLVVEDEQHSRTEITELLSDEGFDVHEADNSESALQQLRQKPAISIVLTDIRMPGKNGLELITQAKQESGSDQEREYVVITGDGAVDEAVYALQLGVLDFITKPIDQNRLLHVISRAAELVNLKRSRKHYEQGLEADVRAKTIEIRRLFHNLENAYAESLDCLATAAEYKDPETGNHIRRIGAYAKALAGELGWSHDRQRMIELAAPLHDAGKIGTPESILLKPGKLTSDEIAVMKQHSEIGHRILSRSNHPTMIYAANIAWCHHERWDGGGYPRGLRGDSTPIEARITTLGDVYDALRSKRPYKPAFDHDKTMGIIIEGDGRTMPEHFDPQLIEIFSSQHESFRGIYDQLTD